MRRRNLSLMLRASAIAAPDISASFWPAIARQSVLVAQKSVSESILHLLTFTANELLSTCGQLLVDVALCGIMVNAIIVTGETGRLDLGQISELLRIQIGLRCTVLCVVILSSLDIIDRHALSLKNFLSWQERGRNQNVLL